MIITSQEVIQAVDPVIWIRESCKSPLVAGTHILTIGHHHHPSQVTSMEEEDLKTIITGMQVPMVLVDLSLPTAKSPLSMVLL